jgi:chemotaxis protein histidine kinase CheA
MAPAVAPTPAPAPIPTPIPVPVADPVVESEELMESYQPGILMELDETFDEKKRKMVRVALSLVKDNAGSDNAICKKLMGDVFKIVHGLNGLLGLLALDKLSELLTEMEQYLSTIQPKLLERSKEQLVRDTEVLTKGIDLAWGLRMSIMNNATERTFFEDEQNSQQYSQLTQVFKG